MSNSIRILSTKKLTDVQKQVFLDAQIVLIDENFIQTQSNNFELSTVYDHLIFTSQNAVQSVLQHPDCDCLKSKKVLAVGAKTKELLTKNGFDVIVNTGYATDLAEIITLIYNQESYTFFCGNLRRNVLPKAFKENGIRFNEIEVYQTNLTPKKIPSKLNGILFFSPSAVESYLKLNTIKDEISFCIGKTTAEALENKKIKNIVIAENPTVENVIDEVIEYYNR